MELQLHYEDLVSAGKYSINYASLDDDQFDESGDDEFEPKFSDSIVDSQLLDTVTVDLTKSITFYPIDPAFVESSAQLAIAQQLCWNHGKCPHPVFYFEFKK